jgi:hypothetical protein
VIPIRQKPEPRNFDQTVRQPGQDFLRSKPAPKKNEWKGKDYWRFCLADLHESYGGICAYSAQWIPLDTGLASVDHYQPKSIAPNLAYEWANFRLVSFKLNSRKRSYIDVLDPFTLADNSFELDFPSLLVKPGQNLAGSDRDKVLITIKRLKLNYESSIKSRFSWLELYCGNHDFHFLQKTAPFIAYELRRQGLEQTITEMMAI